MDILDPGTEDLLNHPQRRWSALLALESLSPPSPSPSGSLGAIATLASLGDLPIFLHTSDDASPQDLNLTASGSPDGPKVATFLAPSDSTTTFHSTNTFGVPRTPDTREYSPEYVTSNDASDCTARQPISRASPRPPSPTSPNPAYLSAVRTSRSAGYFSNRFASISDLSRFTISAYAEPWGSNDNLAASPTRPVSPLADLDPVVSPSGSIIVSPADDYRTTPTSPPPLYAASTLPSTDSVSGAAPSHLAPPPSSRSWSTISTVLFNRRPMSPSPSMASTLGSEDNSPSKRRFRFPLRHSGKPPRSPSVHSDLAGQAVRYTPSGPGKYSHSTPASPLSSQFPHHPCPLLRPSASTGPFSGSGSGSRSGTASGSGHSKTASTVANLPESLDWLRDTCIELWIDQEGFRAIRAKFHLAAYSPPQISPSSPAERDLFLPSPDPTTDALTHGLALFRPVRPQRAVYHHGALDSAPVLRRLTLAGTEERDYISRHASLTVKANGLYAVCGSEALDADADGHAQLHWRFEYAVDDLSGVGAAARGEKGLVPLSFACSPGLLHPSHGKRVRLMHVLKKNIAPKLCARRAAGLGEDAAYNALQWLPELPKMPQGEVGRAKGPSVHRRTQSSDPSATPAWPPVKKARPASVCAALPRPSTTDSPGLRQRPRGHGHANSVASQVSAHIVSPAELAQILEGFPSTNEPGPAQAHRPTELSPPSYYRSRRMLSEMERVDEVGALVL